MTIDKCWMVRWLGLSGNEAPPKKNYGLLWFISLSDIIMCTIEIAIYIDLRHPPCSDTPISQRAVFFLRLSLIIHIIIHCAMCSGYAGRTASNSVTYPPNHAKSYLEKNIICIYNHLYIYIFFPCWHNVARSAAAMLKFCPEIVHTA